MDREQLLNDFLGLYPNSPHPRDRERFLKYALACVIEGKYIDTESMFESDNVSSGNIEKYEIAFGWIRDTFDFVKSNIEPGENYDIFIERLKRSL